MTTSLLAFPSFFQDIQYSDFAQEVKKEKKKERKKRESDIFKNKTKQIKKIVFLKYVRVCVYKTKVIYLLGLAK